MHAEQPRLGSPNPPVHKLYDSCRLPSFAYLAAFLGSPLALIPFLFRKCSLWFRVWTLSFCVLLFAGVVWLPVSWLAIAACIVLLNCIYLVILLLLFPPTRPPKRFLGFSFKHLSALILACLPWALVFAGLEQGLSDILWSRLFPVNFSVSGISQDFVFQAFLIVLLLLLVGIRISFWHRTIDLFGLAWLLANSFLVYSILWQVYLIGVEIPQWQLIQAKVFDSWVQDCRRILMLGLGTFAVPILIGQAFESWKANKSWIGSYLTGLFSIAVAFMGIAFWTGMPAYYSLLIGQQFEKYGSTRETIPWYAKTIQWCQGDELKSYLQFRVALLHRKNGNITEAKEAFVRVMVKYYHDNQVLLKATEFNDRLESADTLNKKRVVIPGVEASTEYKSAYCVPNSLGLILNYWGDRVGAKKIGSSITSLGSGSYITDEAFYAEQRGFRHFVAPLRSFADIKTLIDKKIPVLAFIPGHVLAIFGYDEVLNTIITYDVNTYDIWEEARWEEFKDSWCQEFNLLGIVVPDDSVPILKTILGPGLEEKNEAYLQYMIAQLETNTMKTVAHLRRASGRTLFFADEMYQYFSDSLPRYRGDGEPFINDTVQQKAENFLLQNHVYESHLFNHARSLYQSENYHALAQFLEAYSKENVLSPSLAIIFAGVWNRLNQPEKSMEILLSTVDVNDYSVEALEFLLNQPEISHSKALASQLSLKLLNAESGMDGQSMKNALQLWIENNPVDYRNVSTALLIVDNYLQEWNPYDIDALQFILKIFAIRSFRQDDEINKKLWNKKIKKYSESLRSLLQMRNQ